MTTDMLISIGLFTTLGVFAALGALAALESWRSPERTDPHVLRGYRLTHWLWREPIGPELPPAREGDFDVTQWSPALEVAMAGESAESLTAANVVATQAAFDRIIADWEREPDWLVAFREESMRLPAYRSMILDSTEYTARHAAELRALTRDTVSTH